MARSHLHLALVLGLALPPLSRCSDAAGWRQAQVLKVAGIPIYSGSSHEIDAMMEDWRAEFRRRSGGMDVRFVDQGHGEVSTNQAKTSLIPRMYSIDVAAVDTTYVGELAEHLYPFNGARFLKSLERELLPGLPNHTTADGKQLALPWYTDYGLLFYRTDLLQKYGIPAPGPEGWTYDEVESIARRVQAAERAAGHTDFHGFAWTGQSYEGLTCMALEVIAGHEEEYPLVDKDGTVLVDNPSFIKALERMSNWIWGGEDGSSGNNETNAISPSEVLSFREPDLRRRFCELGNVMFVRHWPSFIADCNNEGMAGRFGVVRNPGAVRGRGRGVLGGQALVISRHSEHKAEARLFVELATSRAWQLQQSRVTKRISARMDVGLNSTLCNSVHRELCRINLTKLSDTPAQLPGRYSSSLTPDVIVNVSSGLCDEVTHVATVCDVDRKKYIISRPIMQTQGRYALASDAFSSALHQVLSEVPRIQDLDAHVHNITCALAQAGGLRTRSMSGAVGVCEWEARAVPSCGKGQYMASNGDCIRCAMLWWGAVCGDLFIYLGLPPMALAMFILVYVYIMRARRQADTIWKVKLTELKFGEPVEVLGRGTFGLVLKAEYRGTTVAVKRVIPPGGGAPFREFGKFEASANQPSFVVSVTHSDPTPRAATPSLRTPASHAHSLWNTEAACQSPFFGTATVLRRQARSVAFWRSAAAAQHAALRQDFIKEMRQLSKLRHPCVLTVMGAVVSRRTEPMLVMELMEHGSLYDLLHNDTMDIEGELVLPILRDVAQGLRFLHAARPVIIHGDLKAQNVLVDSKFRAKVADFGLSQKRKVFGPLRCCGTPLWMAPELLRGALPAPSSDVYALGILLSEVYSRQDPYLGEDPLEVVMAVCDATQMKRPEIPSSCAAEVAVLMRDCWQEDPALRPHCEEIDRRLKALDASAADPGPAKVRRNRTDEDLLHDVFPRHIAEALRDGRKVEPEARDVVTIFFSDIVGFTDISATLEPQKVSFMLDRLYSKLDSLTLEHKIFKVETIGDAYMAVSNLVEDQHEDHAKRIALFAKAAVQAAAGTMIDLEDPGKGFVSIRVGFHSGPVVASVVGTRNLRYCLFGDTVNTASRMESSSERNRVHCSAQAASYLRQQAPEVPLRPRGAISIKGKGDMYTFWVHEDPTLAGLRADAAKVPTLLGQQQAMSPKVVRVLV